MKYQVTLLIEGQPRVYTTNTFTFSAENDEEVDKEVKKAIGQVVREDNVWTIVSHSLVILP